MTTDAAVQIVMLSDEQLDAEIAETRPEVCCSTPWAAARAFCGCKGRAADYLDRLLGEAARRAL